MYHDSLLSGHQGPDHTVMTIRQIHRGMSYLLKDKAKVHEKLTNIR